MASLPLIYNPFSELEEIIGSVFSPSRLHHNATVLSSSRAFRPNLDLHEDAEKNLVTATLELPGVRKEDVQLSVHNNILTISAENKISSEHEESGYAVRERQYGKLSRSLRLSQGVKEEDIRATMADGVLTITFPKSSPEQEPKKIAIA